MFMETGDIWTNDLRALYTKGSSNHRIEYWLILDVCPGNEYAASRDYRKDYYTAKDRVVTYLRLDTGQQNAKVFFCNEFGAGNDHLDLRGNPYYKKVA